MWLCCQFLLTLHTCLHIVQCSLHIIATFVMHIVNCTTNIQIEFLLRFILGILVRSTQLQLLWCTLWIAQPIFRLNFYCASYWGYWWGAHNCNFCDAHCELHNQYSDCISIALHIGDIAEEEYCVAHSERWILSPHTRGTSKEPAASIDALHTLLNNAQHTIAQVQLRCTNCHFTVQQSSSIVCPILNSTPQCSTLTCTFATIGWSRVGGRANGIGHWVSLSVRTCQRQRSILEPSPLCAQPPPVGNPVLRIRSPVPIHT